MKPIVIATALVALQVAFKPCVAQSQDEMFRPCETLRAFDPDYDAALRRAKESGKPLFLLFTGSDWCGFCVKLAREVLAKDEFAALAKNAYELVVLDFPKDENKQTDKQRRRYKRLRQKFASSCGYPTIVLVSPDEKVLYKRSGYRPSESPEKWFTEFRDAAKKSADEKKKSAEENMVIPPGLKTVYLEDFARKMTTVDIPDGVERIAARSGFYPGSVVETIKIPVSVKRIDSHAIVGFWRRLERIETASGSPYVVKNGCLIDTRDSALVFALSGNTQIVVPESVKSILDYAFEGNDAVEVKLPEGLEKIGNQAFTHCSSLQRINIPSTVKRIGRGAFNFCGKLRSIDVSAENKRFRASGGFLIDVETDRLLRAWGDEEVMEIPAGVRIIGEYAFTSMDSLEVVKVPDSVELVGKHAFGWCESLMRIKIPREELRSQIVEEIRDYRSYGKNNGERKIRLGVDGSPNLLPSQILVVGSSDVPANSPNNPAASMPTKQKKD